MRGSSPHTWGLLRHRGKSSAGHPVHPHIRGAYYLLNASCMASIRFIPTYVGLTPAAVLPLLIKSVHPHIRGAYVFPAFLPVIANRFIPTYVGLTIAKLVIREIILRFIPTYVGLTEARVRRYGQALGSSPHTWGLRFLADCHEAFIRFIPTYVGLTYMCGPHSALLAVHPHIRGAYIFL